MIIPTESAFRRDLPRVVIQGQWPLRRPRWIKYGWWIVTEDAPVSGPYDPRFRGLAFRMATLEAMLMARDLDKAKVRYFIHNWSYKRDDPSAPWDIPRLRREGKPVAPAYDDDPDWPWREHK